MLPAAPAVVLRYFEYAAERNTDAILALFAEDAIVIDEGQTRRGISAIREWRTGTAGAYEYTTTITGGLSTGPDTYRVTARLDGNFPGNTVELQFDFTVEGDLICRLQIAP